jgi:hypothetical protein
MSLERSAQSMRKLKPPSAARWDDGIAWGQFLLEGELPVPRACFGTDPLRIWPEIEARAGRGICTRKARFLILPTFAKHFAPPPWWNIEAAQEGVEKIDMETGKPCGWHWQDANPRAGRYRLKLGWALKLTVSIDGVPLGLDEGAAYALAMRT